MALLRCSREIDSGILVVTPHLEMETRDFGAKRAPGEKRGGDADDEEELGGEALTDEDEVEGEALIDALRMHSLGGWARHKVPLVTVQPNLQV